MSKEKTQYTCNVCNSVMPKWSGQCLKCQSWDSLILNEVTSKQSKKTKKVKVEILGQNLIQHEQNRIIIPIKEMNQVLGGGIVTGSAILIGGDPGIGKSTLLIQLVIALEKNGVSCLYISGEESISQIQSRSQRLGNYTNCNVKLASVNILEEVQDVLLNLEQNNQKPQIVIIDSVQTISSLHCNSPSGSTNQIKIVTQTLIDYAKHKDVSVFFVGHVTKDGQIAGPKILEHMVDTVLYFEGDQNNQFRIIRSIKNRFGPVNEIGIFEMKSNGLSEVVNPSQIFLSESNSNIPGITIFIGIEGSRAIPIEIQVLISPATLPIPKRTVVGWDSNRLSMLIAILATRCKINLSSYDVYISVSGGIKITDPAADLAVAAALISVKLGVSIPNNQIFLGEISLSGEIKKVVNFTKRILEGEKIGFKTCICKEHSIEHYKNIQISIENIQNIKHLKDIISN